jgi:hypothetical protein
MTGDAPAILAPLSGTAGRFPSLAPVISEDWDAGAGAREPLRGAWVRTVRSWPSPRHAFGVPLDSLRALLSRRTLGLECVLPPPDALHPHRVAQEGPRLLREPSGRRSHCPAPAHGALCTPTMTRHGVSHGPYPTTSCRWGAWCPPTAPIHHRCIDDRCTTVLH